MKSSVKHEFGHIRQNYSERYGKKRLPDTRKFVTDNIDTSLFNISSGRYEMIKKFMYLFSPVEL